LTIFAGMKRILFHILFWATYLSQDTLLAFLWDAAKFNELTVGTRILVSFKLCVSVVLPKILFTYLVLYYLLDRVLKQKGMLITTIFYGFIAVVSTLLMVRAIEVYFVYPVLFEGNLKSPAYFSPFGFLFALIDLGFVSGAAIAIRQVRLQLVAKEREKILIKDKLEAELKFLKNQTNPHFLFNTLNNIYALARKKSDSTADVVMKLSKILRFMLYESGKKFITIGEEAKLLEDYIDLEKIRYNEKLNIIFNKDIDDNSQEVSPLLLLPFVENAFKHGVSESFFDSTVIINIVVEKGHLTFDIENTKEDEEVEHSVNNKIGLFNIKRQLELMYPEYKLVVDNQPKKFRVNLTVNLNNHGEI